MGGMEVKLLSFLTSAVDGDELSASQSGSGSRGKLLL
jgi:hypothetical protein